MFEINWGPDTQAAAIITGMELQYHNRVSVDIKKEIDLNTGNGAREKAIDTDLVEDYCFAMRNGDVFPCIVLASVDEHKKLRVIGGNHRLQAAVRAGAVNVPAILVYCSEFQASMLSKRLNIVNGKRESRSVRIAQGLDLVQQHGLKVEDAARTAGITPTVLHGAIRLDRVVQKAISLGLRNPKDKLRMTDGHSIGELVNNNDLFPDLYRFATSTKASTETMTSLCKDVRRAKTLEEQKKLIAEAMEKCHETERKKQKLIPVAVSIKRSSGMLCSLIKGRNTLLALQMTKLEAEQLLSDLRAVENVLSTAIGKN